jgi:hypothetical protein
LVIDACESIDDVEQVEHALPESQVAQGPSVDACAIPETMPENAMSAIEMLRCIP